MLQLPLFPKNPRNLIGQATSSTSFVVGEVPSQFKIYVLIIVAYQTFLAVRIDFLGKKQTCYLHNSAKQPIRGIISVTKQCVSNAIGIFAIAFGPKRLSVPLRV